MQVDTRLLKPASDYERQNEPSNADFFLARIGGMSSAFLNSLIAEKTVQSIEHALQVATSIQSLAPSVEEMLFALVPHTGEDKMLRRRILAIKRHIHNGRFWPAAAEDIERVLLALDEEKRPLLQKWYNLALEYERTLQAAAEQYKQETEAAAERLFSSLHNQQFLQGLTLASQEVSKALLQYYSRFEKSDWKPASKIARTSLSYLTRAAMKTSPFSTFTQLSVATLDEEQQPDGIEQSALSPVFDHSKNLVRLTRTIPFTWLMHIARDPELAVGLLFEPNQGISISEKDQDYADVLTADYVYYGQFSGRSERTAKRRFDRRKNSTLIQFLQSNKSLTYSELSQLLIATGQFKNAHKTIVQLLDMQLIKPVAPYRKQEPYPVFALAQILAQLPSPRAQKLSTLMSEIQILCNKIGEAEATTRLEYLTELRQNILTIFAKLGVTPPEWLSSIALIYEDVRSDLPPAVLPHTLQDDLAAFARFLRPRMIRTKTYDYLYHFFIKCFGPDGETGDIQKFLQLFVAQDYAAELTLRTMAEDHYTILTEEDERAYLPAGESSTPPACTIFFQIAAESQAALEQGDYLFIVNQINSGQGGLISRFSSLLQSPSINITEKLQQWVKSLHKGQIIEIPVVSDWSDLQAVQGLSEHILQWPAELSTADKENAITLRSLRLRADSSNQTLYVVDENGQIITPSYLGVIPSQFSPYILYLFLQLLDPWVCDWKTPAFGIDKEVSEQIQFTPRRMSGRIVFQRASWHVPLPQLPQRLKDEDELTFFMRVQEWRLKHQIPEEVFVSRSNDQNSFDAKKRKPIWLHFASPHALELLYQYIDKDITGITLTEVLPSRQQQWLTRPETEPGISALDASITTDKYASEFLALLRWPMPALTSDGPEYLKETYTQPTNWLYFKIYAPSSEMLSMIISTIVLPAQQKLHDLSILTRWFYLRFYDEQGWHIRLRFQVHSNFKERRQKEILTFMEQTLQHAVVYSVPDPKDLETPANNFAPFISVHQYEPEYEKFGGASGVILAERLFEASSIFAMEMLTCIEHNTLTPLQAALLMMESIVNTNYPDPDAKARFLHYYLWYWTNQNREGAAQQRTLMRQKAHQQCLDDANKLLHLKNIDAVSEIVQRFMQVFTETVERCTQILPSHVYSARQFCFDHIHLTNNRLGVSTKDEGYLAALLLTIDNAL